jgi:hypothetical protein
MLVGEPFSANEYESDDWHFSNIDNEVARLQIVQRYLKTQCDDQFVNARFNGEEQPSIDGRVQKSLHKGR